jgi:hypothetical protein
MRVFQPNSIPIFNFRRALTGIGARSRGVTLRDVTTEAISLGESVNTTSCGLARCSILRRHGKIAIQEPTVSSEETA